MLLFGRKGQVVKCLQFFRCNEDDWPLGLFQFGVEVLVSFVGIISPVRGPIQEPAERL